MVTDPVCGMNIDPQRAAASSTYAGKDYFFCSQGCKEQFDRAPEHYSSHPTQGQTVTARGVDVIEREEDIASKGVDVFITHPHTMTRGVDATETPPGHEISRGEDVIQPVNPDESSENPA